MFCRAWPDWLAVSFQNWHHATVDQSLSSLSPTHPRIWIEGDWKRAWRTCLYRVCRLRPSGFWQQSHSSKPGAGNLLLFDDFLPALQFTICSSATSDAMISVVHFFQLLHQSGDPWITLLMQPHSVDIPPVFRLTVMAIEYHCIPLNTMQTHPFLGKKRAIYCRSVSVKTTRKIMEKFWEKIWKNE